MALALEKSQAPQKKEVLISFMENSVYFDHFFIFIMKRGCKYWIYGEKSPGKPFLLCPNNFRSFAEAQDIAEEISLAKAIPLAKKIGCKPRWGPLICPGKKWRLYKCVIENKKIA